jgi:hypothetical protein
MTGTITVNMPMQLYLQKFLLKKYGSSYKVSYNSLLGMFLLEILDKQYRKEHRKITQTSYYPITIPKSIVERVGFDMPTSKMKRFEEMISKLFRTELESYIKLTISADLCISVDQKVYKQDVMKAIKQFLEYYDVTEDDIKLETLYRDFNRQQTDVRQPLETA